MERARRLVQPEPIAPLATPVEVSSDRFGSVRRSYIECLQDRATSPSLQKQMYTALPCDEVVSMDTSHLALLARPGELARQLESLAA